LGIFLCIGIIIYPQIHISQHGKDSILRDASVTDILTGLLRPYLQRIRPYSQQVINQVPNDDIPVRSRKVQFLLVICNSLRIIRYILKRTHQIEITKGTQGRNLGYRSLHVTRQIIRVFLCHFRCFLDDQVATVDDRIETRPIGISIGGKNILAQNIPFCRGRAEFRMKPLTRVVRTALSPDEQATNKIIILHTCVATCHYLVHIVLLIPIIIFIHHGQRINIQKVSTRCHRHSDHGQKS